MMSTYKIRLATLDDLDELLPLFEKALIAEKDDVTYVPIVCGYFRRDPEEFSVCEFEKEIVGFRHITPEAGSPLLYTRPKKTKKLSKKKTCCSGLVYLTTPHTGKRLRFALNYLILKRIIKMKGDRIFMYARPTTKIGEDLLIKSGFKLFGYDLRTDRPYYGDINKPPIYRILINEFFDTVEENLETIKVPYEFC